MAACAKCNCILPKKEFLKCSSCKSKFDLDCANVSIQRFINTMDAKHKKSWQCQTCRKLQKELIVPESSHILSSSKKDSSSVESLQQDDLSNFSNNVTIRQPRRALFRSNSCDLLTETECLNILIESTHLSRSTETLTEEVETEIHILKNKLQSTEIELSNTIMENTELKQEISTMSKKIVILTDLCKSPPPKQTKSLLKKKRLSKVTGLLSPSEIPPYEEDIYVTPHSSFMDSLDVSSVSDDKENTAVFIGQECPIQHLKLEIESLQTELGNTREEITRLNKIIKDLESKIICNIEEQHMEKQGGLKLQQKEPNFCECVSKNSKIKRKLIVLGDQQASGIAPRLLNERHRKCLGYINDYDIIGIPKPNAPSAIILDQCSSLGQQLSDNDKLILCIGANDSNPKKLATELSIALRALVKTKVIVVSIRYNPYLNIMKLNEQLLQVVKRFPNCTFLNMSEQFSYTQSYKMNLAISINNEINSVDYNEKYLVNSTVVQSKRFSKLTGNAFHKRTLELNSTSKSLCHNITKPMSPKTNTHGVENKCDSQLCFSNSKHNTSVKSKIHNSKSIHKCNGQQFFRQ